MLYDFNLCINTKFVFGKNSLEQIGLNLKNMGIKKVLIHYDNGKFLYDTGLLDNIKENLKSENIESIELGGVLPNPRLSLVRKGIKLAKKENIDMVLAIGGGSVIDSAKAIGLGAVTDDDIWDFFKGIKIPIKSMPIGVVLTYPATGSESSAVTIINNTDEKMKLLVSNDIIRPVIAFMNPEITYSLPKFLTACGVVDMFSHICERYFSSDKEIGVIDRMSEGMLKTLVDIGVKVLENPTNYSYRAEIMWIGTIAHNNTIGIGRIQDWATHEIGNELSALYDTPHGVTLSIIMCSWMEYVYKKSPERFARYAREVFNIKDIDNIEKLAYKGIEKTKEFFKKMGMPTSFKDFNIPTDNIDTMLNNIAFNGNDNSIGGIVRLNREDCLNIYKKSF